MYYNQNLYERWNFKNLNWIALDLVFTGAQVSKFKQLISVADKK